MDSIGERRIKVLHLEDVPSDAELVARAARAVLSNLDITRVDTEADFAAALEQHPDIVLLGCNAPKLDGRVALKMIRARDPDLPVIVVTGALGDAAAADMIKAGANYYVLKDRLAGLGHAMRRALLLREETHSLNAARAALAGAFESTIAAVAALFAEHDPYTATHQQRVSRLARAIAAQIGFSDRRAHGLHVTGLIHDIGKIRVPAELLSRPGKLSIDEFALIKGHPAAGYDVLRSIAFPWPVAEIVLQHHERMDGSGYPRGLGGGQILLEARILAVADVVEAMSSHRPYRPALGLEAALAEIAQNRGRLYDESAVDACTKLFRDGGFVL